MSAICLSLTSPTLDGSVRQLERYRKYIDMAELRLDLTNPEERPLAGDFPARAGMPVILTLRLPSDGGRWGDAGETETAREELLINLLESGGWAYVDLEFDKPLKRVGDAARRAGTEVIRSVFDFEGKLLSWPAARLAGLIREMAEKSCIPKLAAFCTGSRQLLNLARTAMALEKPEKKILLGMGEYGTPSRILAQRLGSSWTYTSPAGDGEERGVPGLPDPEILESVFRFHEIEEETPLYGVAGNPVAHSRSPGIHNRWLIDSGLRGTYLPFRSDDLGALIETCDIWGVRGLSITVPHKEKALALCDYSGTLARKIGAANTMLRAGDGWRARNTDAAGFLSTLPEALNLADPSELKGLRALIIGAGGAARAAVHALSEAGVELVILNRTESKARLLAGEIGALWGPLSRDSHHLLRDGIDFAVQTTSVGMAPRIGDDPIPWWDFAGCSLVYDMVYEPAESALLARARAEGTATLNGAKMLEAQARLQFELFTGRKAPGRF